METKRKKFLLRQLKRKAEKKLKAKARIKLMKKMTPEQWKERQFSIALRIQRQETQAHYKAKLRKEKEEEEKRKVKKVIYREEVKKDDN
jgi:hypothetical protein